MSTNLTQTLTNLFLAGGYFGIVLAMAIESCCIPLPSELIMPLAGFLAYQNPNRFSVVGIAIAGAVGCVIGSAVAYWIGASEGRSLLLRYGKYVLISPRDAERADQWFARHGEITIFATRLMPIIRTFISLPAGIARMNFTRFVVYTFLGSLPWCFALGLTGYELGKNWHRVGSALHAFDAVVIVAVVALVALFVYRHLHDQEGTPASERSDLRSG